MKCMAVNAGSLFCESSAFWKERKGGQEVLSDCFGKHVFPETPE